MPAPKKSVAKTRREAPASRRTYESPLRRQQAVDTRDRILSVGADIARQLPAWDWRGMTYKVVGEHAGMNERTVRRYFATERALRDGIQKRLLQECGVDYARLELPSFADAATQVLRYLDSFASTPQNSSDPGFMVMDQERRTLLLKAVTRAAPSWTPMDQAIAAATLDLLWTPVNFERLGTGWQLDQQNVTKLIHWAVSLVQDAVREGKRPT